MEVAWICDHMRDVIADFRAVYHLGWRDALALPGPELMALAYRLPVYPGAVAARAAEQARQSHVPPGARVVESTSAALMRDPVLGDVIQIG